MSAGSPYKGRMKGESLTHMPNDKTRETHEQMKWDSPQFCETCWNKPCKCNDRAVTPAVTQCNEKGGGDSVG